ncbi:hypothetical protein Acr_00g0082470 [Actinidia rufa]|uniref:Uncharacterized protein n=1 Tax=Actinidia rufa TaxID=165716 RepID=A0A7J0DV85_9ERIC|nr:hypothetical protein Acr_00g0082470 [Actinidia rufa]
MKLSRAKLLVHDDVALNKFRANHDIPLDVQIERHGTNGDANLVKGYKDRITVRTWLIHQAGLRFPISPMLKECQGLASCVHRFLTKKGVGCTLFQGQLLLAHQEPTPATNEISTNASIKGLKIAKQPSRKGLNNRQALRKVIDLLAYEPIYRHMILHKAELPNVAILTQEILAPSLTRQCHLPEFLAGRKASLPAPRPTFLHEEGEEAISQLMLNRRRNHVLPAAEPEVPTRLIDISSSDNEHSDDLAYNPLQLASELEIVHSFWKGDDSDASSGSANMSSRFKTLG